MRRRSLPELPAGARVTGRLRRSAATMIAGGVLGSRCGAQPPDQISWPIAHDAFVARPRPNRRHRRPYGCWVLMRPAVADLVGPRVLGCGPSRSVWRRTWSTWPAPAGCSGEGSGRTKRTVVDWLDGRGQDLARTGRTRWPWRCDASVRLCVPWTARAVSRSESGTSPRTNTATEVMGSSRRPDRPINRLTVAAGIVTVVPGAGPQPARRPECSSVRSTASRRPPSAVRF